MSQATDAGPQSQFHHVLATLEASLQDFHELLSEPDTKQELFNNLHNSAYLPDRHVFDASQRIVDQMRSIEHLLEPAPLKLADHFLGYTTTKCLVAAVELDICGHLGKGSLSLDELASKAQAKPQRLGQILRPLYTNNIFSYDEETGKYSNNHVSTLLDRNHWTQWHNWVHLYGNQFYDIAGGIPRAVKDDGNSRWAAQHVYDTDENMFAFFQRQGWVPLLHKTLGGGATAMAPGIVADYPWHELADTTVLDVGGGGGALIASLLRSYPTMKGAVLELPSVIDHISPSFAPGGAFEDIGSRVTHLIKGDFLKEVPAFTAYTIKWVLHDWCDADAVAILRNIRNAIQPAEEGKPASRLVVLESILSDRRSQRLSVYGDINMMMTANGQERTEKQWRMLAEDAGWTVHSIHPLRNAWVQAIDLRPTTPSSAARLDEEEESGPIKDPLDQTLASGTQVKEGIAHGQVSDEPDTPGLTNASSAMDQTTQKSPTIAELPQIIHGDTDADGRVVLYIIKADQTSYINYIKPLILALELCAPHVLSIIDTKDEWYFKIHPQRMVPALKDKDPITGEECVVFESTACLQYLCERFDTEGDWSGRTAAEKGRVMAWTAYQTAALGPTAKYWLYFLRGYPNRQNPTPLPKTIEQLHKDTARQWDILERRLAEPEQSYVALKDRPTIADLSYLPFCMPYMFKLFSVDIEDWPHIKRWSEKMLARPAIKHVLERAPTLGH